MGWHRTDEIISKYPELKPIHDNGFKRPVGEKKQMHLFCVTSCSICGSRREVRWSDICYAYEKYGRYSCNKCRATNLNTKYRSLCHSPEVVAKAQSSRESRSDYKDQIKKMVSSQTKESHQMSADNHDYEESFRKRALTLLANGNGSHMRSGWEVNIDTKYGSVHAPIGYTTPEGITFKYELDCYFPGLHKGIEIDGPFHDEGKGKKQGYHKAKDDYFSKRGITILHLTHDWCKNNWSNGKFDEVVSSFVNGSYTGSLIDLEDKTYGDILYIDEKGE